MSVGRRRRRCRFRRGGTLAYLAAWDVAHARLFGRGGEKTGIEPFGRLVEQVMSSEPYASAKTVFWVVDDGSSHAGQASIDRLEDASRQIAKPFDCTFTRSNLDALLARLASREPQLRLAA